MATGKLTSQIDDEARRAYWTARLDEADAFLRDVAVYPVQESGESMTSLPIAVRSAGVEVIFSDRPHVLGLSRLFFLRAGLIESFLAAAAEMNARGWVLKVEDGYRTVEMQRGLGRQAAIFASILDTVRWECRGATPPVDLLGRRIAALVANAPKVGTHMSGSAIDISVLRRGTGAEVDRGAPYIEMSEKTPMTSPFVSTQAQDNRREITTLMGRHGFVAYPWEFWHYNAGDAYAESLNRTGQPARYGAVHVDPGDGRVTPIANPLEALNTPAEILKLMKQVLAAGLNPEP